MLFPTADFALFFCVVLVVAWSLSGRAGMHRGFLILASYFFYGYWDWRFCLLMFLASFVAWAGGFLLERNGDRRTRQVILWTCVGAMLAVLGFFKYYGFFLDALAPALEAAGLSRDMMLLQIVLPVGISFFTFQSISYVVDVYRRELPGDRPLADILLYVSFFPQLVAGPIVRASDFLPQLDRPPLLTRRLMIFGLALCLTGLAKKMVVANYLAADLVDPVFFDPSARSSLELLVAVYGYAVQIYCDFSGYSDIAIGTAALMGYYFNPNFDRPYRSQSLREFWQRWHISLSQWLRDYLYKPLGGNRGGRLATARNLLVTMVLGGLWHGAAWTFLLWGLLHGSALAVSRLAGLDRPASGRLWAVAKVVVTFHVVCLGWILFRSQSVDTALQYIAGLSALTVDASSLTGLCIALIGAVLALQFLPFRLEYAAVRMFLPRSTPAIAIAGAGALVAIALLAPPGTAPFIYFQF